MSGAAAASGRRAPDAVDFIDVSGLLTDEERLIRDTVRAYVRDRVLPNVAEWFEAGMLPRELGPELGRLGLLGMHLDGYGCPGASAVAYGLACLELEAGDSGLRSFASVQGSLAMFAIHRWGDEAQKQQWLPAMARGERIGCFGLTEPDFGSNPAGMRTFARRDGSDWVLDGTKMWITNGSIADLAIVWAQTDDGIRGFIVPRGTRGFHANDIHRKLSLRASVTSELVLSDCRLPGEALLPLGEGLGGAARVSQRSALRNRLGRDGRGASLLRNGARVQQDARAVRSAHRRLSNHAAEAGGHAPRARQRCVARAAPRPSKRRRPAASRRKSASPNSTTCAKRCASHAKRARSSALTA